METNKNKRMVVLINPAEYDKIQIRKKAEGFDNISSYVRYCLRKTR